MIGISENAVLAFCAALRTDIVAIAGPGQGVATRKTPARERPFFM